MSIFIPARQDVIDEDIVQATTAALTVPSTGNTVVTLTIKNARRAFLAFAGQAWDASIDTYVTWRVKVNGATVYRLRDSTVQLAPPEEIQQELTPWIELPQGAIVTMEADVATGAGSGTVTGRLRVYYAPIESNL